MLAISPAPSHDLLVLLSSPADAGLSSFMNTNPETDLDLEKLFLPAWAQADPAVNRYAKFAGGDDRPDRNRDDRRGPSRPPGARREGGGGGGGRGFGGPRRDGPARGAGGPRRDGGAGRPQRDGHGGPRRDDLYEQRAAPAPLPLPEVNATLVPDEKGVESLARQIKMTGRAYPLFDIARLILQKPERYAIRFAVKKNAGGQPVQPLFVCALDETLWLSEEEVVAHVLLKHFATFYQAERTATEPPKGTYTFVAQCGLSGVILGPPNHHDYQNQLRKVHSERFARMPFDAFKARVKIVRDEAVVKQWVDDLSWKTEYICLNVPEPLRLPSREEVEKHFRATHQESIIKAVDTQVVSGVAVRGMRSQGLARLAREVTEDQRHFPLIMATSLSQQFAQHGLQFFKVNKTVTHVSVARPHFLDLEVTPVSDGVKRLVEFINAKPRCTRRKLIDALAPSPAPAPIAVAPIPVPPVEDEATPKPVEAPEPTPEQTALIGDLHWLIHQGHVIEFANGALETAKKPLPRPPKAEKKPAPDKPAEAAPVAPEETPATGEVVGSAETETDNVTESEAAEAVPIEPAPAAVAADASTVAENPAAPDVAKP